MSKERSVRILVVDDEASARSGLEKLLKQEGYEVTSADDGTTALERFSESAADVVVTDLKMPKMDGIELLTKLREQDQDVPVLVCTAASLPRQAEIGTWAPVMGKPFDLGEIERILDAIAEGRGSPLNGAAG